MCPLHCYSCGLFVKNEFSPSLPHLPISSSGKYSEYKPSWPPEPIGQNKLWKTNRNSSQLPRPPPGLTNQKQVSPSPWGSGGPRLARSWGGGGINQESRFGPGTVLFTRKGLNYFITMSDLITEYHVEEDLFDNVMMTPSKGPSTNHET